MGAGEAARRDAGDRLGDAARYAAVWLKLHASVFNTATSLALGGTDAPERGSPAWGDCLRLVRVARRLEAVLGRRGTVRRWLTGPNLALRPTPLHVLGQPGGLARVEAYLDSFRR